MSQRFRIGTTALVTLVACSSESRAPARRAPHDDDAGAAAIDVAPPATPPKPVQDRAGLVVSSVGSEPRRSLQYAIAAGLPARASRITVDGNAVSESGGQRTENSLPIAMDVVVGTTKTYDGGRADLRLAAATLGEQVHMPPVSRAELVRAWKTATGAFVGLRMTQAGPPRSQQDDVALPEIAVPAAAHRAIAPSLLELATAIEQVAVTWPYQPIGPGATWQVRRVVVNRTGGEGDGYFVTHVIDFTLTALDGDLATVHFSARRTTKPDPPGQAHRYPHQVPGLEFELLAFEGEATGDATIDLRRPWPVHETIDETTHLRVQLFAAGAPLTDGQVTLDKKLGIVIADAPTPAPVPAPPPPFAPRTDGAYCAKLGGGTLECVRFLAGGVVARADGSGTPADQAHLLAMHARDHSYDSGPWFATDRALLAAVTELHGASIRYELAPAAGDRLAGTRVDVDGRKQKVGYTFAPMTFAP